MPPTQMILLPYIAVMIFFSLGGKSVSQLQTDVKLYLSVYSEARGEEIRATIYPTLFFIGPKIVFIKKTFISYKSLFCWLQKKT